MAPSSPDHLKFRPGSRMEPAPRSQWQRGSGSAQQCESRPCSSAHADAVLSALDRAWAQTRQDHSGCPGREGGSLRPCPAAGVPGCGDTTVLRLGENVRGPLLPPGPSLGALVLQVSDESSWQGQRVQEFEAILADGLSNPQPAKVSQRSWGFCRKEGERRWVRLTRCASVPLACGRPSGGTAECSCALVPATEETGNAPARATLVDLHCPWRSAG